MGSGNSRLGSRPSRSRVNRSTKRRFSSYLMCGGASSSSHAPIHEMDESPAELLACSAEGHNTVNMDEHQRSIKEELSTLCTEIECPRSTLDEPRDRNNAVTVSPAECNTRCVERVNEGKTLSERKELVQLASNDGHSLEPRTQRIGDVGSSSYTEQQSQHSVSNAVIGVDKSKTEGASRIFPEEVCSSSTSHQEPELACAARVLPTENPSNDVLGNHSSDTSSVLTFSDSSLLTSHPLRDTTSQAANTATPGFLMLDSQRDRSGSVLHVDVVSISSGSLFGGTREVSSREARRNSRRLFWDAFSRRSSRRHSDSRTIFFSSEGTDDLGSQDRWLLDFSGDIFEDGVGSDSGYLGNRSHGMSEGRWQSRSEIWDRFRSGLDESSRQTAICATGLHPYGTCSCESFLTGEESSTRGSISRIVMLAEALFEVLDEIHRQPAAFSLSMVSTPAPESIVNSFPLKSYKKLNTAKNGEEIDQCYICLAEYEEEDNIRVLPCHHEYHMACVDKWLKEIHGYNQCSSYFPIFFLFRGYAHFVVEMYVPASLREPSPTQLNPATPTHNCTYNKVRKWQPSS